MLQQKRNAWWTVDSVFSSMSMAANSIFCCKAQEAKLVPVSQIYAEVMRKVIGFSPYVANLISRKSFSNDSIPQNKSPPCLFSIRGTVPDNPFHRGTTPLANLICGAPILRVWYTSTFQRSKVINISTEARQNMY